MAGKPVLASIAISSCRVLKRNPQYLSDRQMESLKASIKRDGFCAPILVRKIDPKTFEIISGNHRFMAAKAIGMKEVPAVIANLTKAQAQRLAVNLNTIHGEPTAELMAPFLAELDIETLRDIHIEESMRLELIKFDANLKQSLDKLQIPNALDIDSVTSPIKRCKCPKCGRVHCEAA